jgi:meiotically up-regulated gene 157 (Mug157) protein
MDSVCAEQGVGALWRSTGLLASPFRPSDDATTLPFLVPANCMAVVELNRMATLLKQVDANELASLCSSMAAVIDEVMSTPLLTSFVSVLSSR